MAAVIMLILFTITIIGLITIWLWCEVLETKKERVISGIVMAGVTAAICIGIALYICNTESGKRLIKSTESNLNGGIERTVTVYDVEGDVIATYSGKFDVDYDSERILFDDENDKRHVIYYHTGTVIVDEN